MSSLITSSGRLLHSNSFTTIKSFFTLEDNNMRKMFNDPWYLLIKHLDKLSMMINLLSSTIMLFLYPCIIFFTCVYYTHVGTHVWFHIHNTHPNTPPPHTHTHSYPKHTPPWNTFKYCLQSAHWVFWIMSLTKSMFELRLSFGVLIYHLVHVHPLWR